jgi:hypothetical protein
MADSSGMAEIRGIDIDKLAKGFADEEIVLKRFVTLTNTSAREIRWYQKTSGFLDSSDTTAVTTSQIKNVAFRARPVVVEQSWTRKTSYVRKYFVESPLLSDEDIKDSDVDILATNVRDLVRAIAHQVDTRIWDVLTESRSASEINEVSITNEWDDHDNCVPISDLMQAKKKIRENGYDPEGAILMLNPEDHMQLLSYLIETKGSSIPGFSSEKIRDGVAMEILGLRVVVNTIVTDDYACVFVPQRACTWKSFVPITSTIIEDKGIGSKIRVWEEGEALLTDPKAVCLLSNTNS